MSNGGNHAVGLPSINPPEGGVFEKNSFEPGNPDLQEEWNVDPQFAAGVDPLAGKSGKDSLSEEEAQLS